jgi:hypothetical protein
LAPKGSCNQQTIAGKDTPDDRYSNMGQGYTNIDFLYETFSIADKIEVFY